MKMNVNENDLEKVCGGSVIVDNTHNTVTFSTLKRTRELSCHPKQVIAYVQYMQLWHSAQAKDEKGFEMMIENELDEKGWLI